MVVSALTLVAASAPAHADDAVAAPETNSAPGAPRRPSLDMSPAAPPVAATPGGRAPSFGAPAPDGDWSFRIGARIAGWESLGIGRRPQNPPAGYSGTALHVPSFAQGRQPFFAGAGATLLLQYGNPIVTAYAIYYGRFNSPQDQGYFTPVNGPSFGQAYIQVTPEPLGALHMLFRVGAFTESYGGPGQWGWGIYGPMLAVRGYGETSNFEYDLTPDLRLTLIHGVLAVPGVPTNFVRGDYNAWIEPGVSDYLQHAHLGLTYQNQYAFRLHYASAHGTDERPCTVYTGVPNADCPILTALNTRPHDGRFDTFLAEAHLTKDPFGQAGLAVGLWNFDHAASVGDGIWWGLDWTQGARDMVTKFLGPNTSGTGKVVAVSAEFDTSLSRLLWYPRSFDGNGPDLRIAVAAELFRTIETDDPSYRNGSGYYIGTELEYRALSWLSFTFQGYGESRVAPRYVFLNDPTQPNTSNVVIVTPATRWEVFSLNPGIRFHTDWSSTDSIQIIYGRRFYSSAVDNNPAEPLDRDVLTLGGYVQF
jgi:hypothetical protein